MDKEEPLAEEEPMNEEDPFDEEEALGEEELNPLKKSTYIIIVKVKVR